MDVEPEYLLLRLFGSIFLVVSTVALFFEICVLVAVFRLSRKNEQFVLLFSEIIAEALMLLQFVWLSVEILLQKTTGMSHKAESILIRASGYPEALHLILVAFNRSHSIVFPLAHHNFWSRRNLILCASACWIVGWALDFYITLGIPSDDMANFGHDIGSVEFGRMDRTKFGADDLLRANLILYCSVVAICATVYSVALVTIVRGIFGGKKSSSLAWQSSDAKMRLRLFVICFTNFIPFSIMIYFNYISPPRTLLGSFFKTFFNILNSVVNSTLLFLFSSWVRKKMPWPFANCLPNFTPFQSAVTTVAKREGTTVFKKVNVASVQVKGTRGSSRMT